MSEGASPGRWLAMGVTGMVSGLAGGHGRCEPVEVVGDGRYECGEQARGGVEVVRARGFAAWCVWEAIFAGSQLTCPEIS